MPESKSLSEDPIQSAMELLWPVIEPIIQRINVDEFTTAEFIQALNMDPQASRLYETLIQNWPETDERLTRLVIHGQVVPQLLRRSRLVDWNGYAYDQEDPFGVPAWWKKIDTPAG